LAQIAGFQQGLLLLALAAGGLGLCLLGCILYRPALAAIGFVGGGILGGLLVGGRMPLAAGSDYVVGFLLIGGLLGLAGWFIPRVAFSLFLASAIALLVVGLAGRPESAGWWVLGILVGLAAGGLGVLHVRRSFVAATALGGAFLGAWAIGSLLSGSPLSIYGGHRWLLLLLLGLSLPVAALGAICQLKLARVVSVSSLPPRPPRPARHAAGHAGVDMALLGRTQGKQ
jgi:hypothetical protein